MAMAETAASFHPFYKETSSFYIKNKSVPLIPTNLPLKKFYTVPPPGGLKSGPLPLNVHTPSPWRTTPCTRMTNVVGFKIRPELPPKQSKISASSKANPFEDEEEELTGGERIYQEIPDKEV